MDRLIEDIKEVVDSYLPYRQIISIPIDKLLFHYLNIHGVYILYLDKNIIYIGDSTNIGSRLKAHIFSNSSSKKEVTKVDIIRFNENSLEVESQLIDKFKPKYNKSNGNVRGFSLPENFDMDELISNIKLGIDK